MVFLPVWSHPWCLYSLCFRLALIPLFLIVHRESRVVHHPRPSTQSTSASLLDLSSTSSQVSHQFLLSFASPSRLPHSPPIFASSHCDHSIWKEALSKDWRQQEWYSHSALPALWSWTAHAGGPVQPVPDPRLSLQVLRGQDCSWSRDCLRTWSEPRHCWSACHLYHRHQGCWCW